MCKKISGDIDWKKGCFWQRDAKHTSQRGCTPQQSPVAFDNTLLWQHKCATGVKQSKPGGHVIEVKGTYKLNHPNSPVEDTVRVIELRKHRSGNDAWARVSFTDNLCRSFWVDVNELEIITHRSVKTDWNHTVAVGGVYDLLFLSSKVPTGERVRVEAIRSGPLEDHIFVKVSNPHVWRGKSRWVYLEQLYAGPNSEKLSSLISTIKIGMQYTLWNRIDYIEALGTVTVLGFMQNSTPCDKGFMRKFPPGCNQTLAMVDFGDGATGSVDLGDLEPERAARKAGAKMPPVRITVGQKYIYDGRIVEVLHVIRTAYYISGLIVRDPKTGKVEEVDHQDLKDPLLSPFPRRR